MSGLCPPGSNAAQQLCRCKCLSLLQPVWKGPGRKQLADVGQCQILQPLVHLGVPTTPTFWEQLPQHRQQSRTHVVHAAPPQLNTDTGHRKKLAVFVSGGGSNFKAIHAACLSGQIIADIVAVVSDIPNCGGVQYAQQHGMTTFIFPASKNGTFPGLTTEQLVQQLTQELKVDFVLLAGYLKLVPAELVRCFKRAMLNIHPGLLPSFGGKGYYGKRVHQAVIQSGARFSGPTVHFVDEEYDTGPILAQRCVSVYPTDTPKRLAARVLQQEHQVYPYAVAALVDGRLTWRGDGIPIIWEAH
eukprot:GHRR01010143.1.p1 GENE.GHRR01010143.1~~GHRR01010143.1.p1  ORF type:complete len:300 (+),score=95.38 GHRR01010143.1:232-1131(+)